MKTISQLATEIGVSVQTIYRLLNKVKHEADECLTEKINGISHITEIGEDIIRERLTNVKRELNASNRPLNNVKQAETEEITYLREQNKVLLDELAKERAHGREQADKLSDLAAQLAELSRNNQILLSTEQNRTASSLLTGGSSSDLDEQHQQPTKRRFWDIFKR